MNRSALLFLLTLGLGACHKEADTAKEETPTAKPFFLANQTLKELAFDTVRLEPMRSEQSFSGQVTTNGDKTANVVPLVGGVVEDLRVELGGSAAHRYGSGAPR